MSPIVVVAPIDVSVVLVVVGAVESGPGGGVDPYVGAGAAYVLFDEIDDSEALADEDISVMEFDDTLGLMVGGGVNIGIFENFAINVDVRYVDIEPDTSATFDRGDFVSEQSVEYSPLLASIGVSWRF